MSPLKSPFGVDGQFVSDGATVSLLTLGPAGTELELDAPTPAKLTFSARFLEAVRTGEEETRELATLDGELLRAKGDGGRVVFKINQGDDDEPVALVPTEPVADDEDADEDDPREVRILRFAFDSGQFFTETPPAGASELAVRIDAARFRYLEVSAQLEIAGTEEAPSDADDVLDVLITARNPGRRRIIELRLTDAAGEVLPGATLQIVSGATPAEKGADPNALTADGDGKVRLKTDPAALLCEVTWTSADGDGPFERTIFLDLGDDPAEADARRLSNLGYTDDEVIDRVLGFQADFARPATGRLSDIAADLRALHDEGIEPKEGEVKEPSTDAIVINGPVERGDDLEDPSEQDDAAAFA